MVGTLAPTGLSLQGVPLPGIQMPPASTGRGAELFFFKLEQPRPPLPGGGTPSCLSLIDEADLGESTRAGNTKKLTADFGKLGRARPRRWQK